MVACKFLGLEATTHRKEVDVTDIANDLEYLKTCGMTFNDRDFVDVGHVKTIYGYDPEGNVIEVQQTAPDNDFRLERVKG